MRTRRILYHLLLWVVGIPLLAVSVIFLPGWFDGNWAIRLLLGITLLAGVVATWVAVFRPVPLEFPHTEQLASENRLQTACGVMFCTLLQAFLGLGVALAMFVSGVFISDYLPHDPNLRHAYLTGGEQMFVAALIAVATAAVALAARFAVAALFLTAAFVAGLLKVVGEYEEIAPHTALPIAVAAILVAAIRVVYALSTRKKA